jgi:hypothetical protein
MKQGMMQGICRNRATFAAAAAVLAFVSPILAGAQHQTYKDPTGTYSVAVPKGWESQPQAGSPMVSIVDPKSKISVTLGIMRGPQANTPTAESQLQNIEKQFPQSCPQAKIQERGHDTVAGMEGSFLLVHCSDASGPQTMKVSAATKPGIVALVITSSPGNAYLRELIPLSEIHSSFKLVQAGGAQNGMQGGRGQGGMNGMGGGQNQGMGQGTNAGMASPQGGFPASAGAPMQPMGGGAAGPADGMGSGGGAGQGGTGGFSPSATTDSGSYHDPQGRYSLAVPSGWNTASDNGNLTLSSGAAWVSVATGTAGSASEESHNIVQQIESQYKNFQILNQGDFQSNGHPAHGTNATGVNPKGQRVSVLVVSIGAGGSNYLVLISSSPNEQAKEINGTVMQIAQSVHFAGE